jgi:hypothetical protein
MIMNESFLRRNLVMLQWIVIGVLLVGGGLATGMAVHSADKYHTEIQNEAGVLASLKEQAYQARHPSSILQ